MAGWVGMGRTEVFGEDGAVGFRPRTTPRFVPEEVTNAGNVRGAGVQGTRATGAGYFAGNTCTASMWALPLAEVASTSTAKGWPALKRKVPRESQTFSIVAGFF